MGRSTQQTAVALLITSVFLIVFIRVSPYASPILDTMQGISLAAQAATLFCKCPVKDATIVGTMIVVFIKVACMRD